MSSSWNGLIHTWRRNVSLGCSSKRPGIFLCTRSKQSSRRGTHAPPGEPLEEAMGDEGGQRVEDVAALLVEEGTEQRLIEALELVASGLPVGGVPVVAGVGVVHHHRDAGVLAQPPERVERRERGRQRGAVG